MKEGSKTDKSSVKACVSVCVCVCMCTCVNDRQVELCKRGWKILHSFLSTEREPEVTRISDICKNNIADAWRFSLALSGH